MNENGGNQGFVETFKNIVFQKDQLEDHFGQALELAGTSRDKLEKLNSVVIKTQKLVEEMKAEVRQRMDVMIGSVSVSDKKMEENVPAPEKFTTKQQEPEKRLPLPVVTTANENPGLSRSEIPTCNTGTGAGDAEYYNLRQRGYMDYPVTQRVFLPVVTKLTQKKDVYEKFKMFGKIVEIYLFAPKTPTANFRSGCVVYDNANSARKAIGAKFAIHGVTVQGAEFKNKDELTNGKNRKEEPLRYQVYLRTIPRDATVEQVLATLECHVPNLVKDIRLRAPTNDVERHSGIGWAALKSEAAADRLVSTRLIHVLGKQVICERNTKSTQSILYEKCVTIPERPSPTVSNMTSRSGSSQSINVLETKGLGSADLSRSSPSPEFALASLVEEKKVIPVSPESQSGKPCNVSISEDTHSISEPLSCAPASSTPAVNGKCKLCGNKEIDCVLLWCGHDEEVCMICGYGLLKNGLKCPAKDCSEIVKKIDYKGN